jgi:hypothetical protein
VTSIEAAVECSESREPAPDPTPVFEELYAAYWAPLVRLGQL